MTPSFIKLRVVGAKRWLFLTSAGGCTSLRVHASRFPSAEKAQALIDANKADNPEWEWKVVDA